jgi:hypothetical protein
MSILSERASFNGSHSAASFSAHIGVNAGEPVSFEAEQKTRSYNRIASVACLDSGRQFRLRITVSGLLRCCSVGQAHLLPDCLAA